MVAIVNVAVARLCGMVQRCKLPHFVSSRFYRLTGARKDSTAYGGQTCNTDCKWKNKNEVYSEKLIAQLYLLQLVSAVNS